MSSSPSLNVRMCSWQVVVPPTRAVRHAVDHHAAHAADAFAAVVIERDRLLALGAISSSFTTSSISEERHVVADVLGFVAHEAAGRVRALLAPDVEHQVHRAGHYL